MIFMNAMGMNHLLGNVFPKLRRRMCGVRIMDKYDNRMAFLMSSSQSQNSSVTRALMGQNMQQPVQKGS